MLRRIAGDRLSLRHAAWLLPCALAVHEAEEWNIVPWFHAYFSPPTPLTDRAAHLGLLVVSLAGFLATGLAMSLATLRAALLVLLPLFGFVAFGNALQHTFWWLYLGTYAPGVATALLAVIPATLYVSRRAYTEGEVSARFVVAALGLGIIPLASAVTLGGRLLPEHLVMHRFFVRLAGYLWGAA
jgi:hypothetical protein